MKNADLSEKRGPLWDIIFLSQIKYEQKIYKVCWKWKTQISLFQMPNKHKQCKCVNSVNVNCVNVCKY